MKKKRFFTLLLLLLCAFPPILAQQYSTTNKKAIALYEEGIKAFQMNEWEKAEVNFLMALKKDPSMVEPYIYLGDMYTLKNDKKKSFEYYKKALSVNPDFYPPLYVWVGELYVNHGLYDSAEYFLNIFLKNYNQKYSSFEQQAMKELANCAFAKKAMQNPVPFNPINLGPAINSPLSEYFPSITADNTYFLFTRRLIDKNTPTGYNEDFYVARKKQNNPDASWEKAVNLGPPVNSFMNEGAPSLSADGQYLFFTACEIYGDYGEGRKGFGSCDIFFTRNLGTRWSRPVNLGSKINSPHWESQPSFSADGKTLYFVRGVKNRDGSKQQDIYYSRLLENGTWTEAKPIPGKVNTPFTEESVYIHPDGKTLYFSSNGHPGMGGVDIFYSRLQDDGTWGEPVNLGYPVNTHSDENSVLVSSDGNLAFFASDRSGGLGELDLYAFEMPEHAKPLPVSYFKGKIFDADTKRPLEARFQLIDLKADSVIAESYSYPETGEFLLVLPLGREYALNVSKKGYMFYSDHFELIAGQDGKPVEKDVPLQPIKPGNTIILKNIFYETAKFDLEEKSRVELNKLAEFLKENPRVKIEISGHTDNVGKYRDNLLLSERRAQKVYEYLIRNGIDASRLSFKGYADTKPIATNETEKGRALNRRTEITILSVD